MHLISCASDDANVSVAISSSPFLLIPTPALSCLATRNAASSGSVPTNDIMESYFKVPIITFRRKNTTNILVIAKIKITVNIPGSPTPMTCQAGGDSLAALSNTWWNNPGREASVDVGTETFQTDCALSCGGIAAGDTPYTASGIMEVSGLERNTTSLEEVPVKIQTAISIQNY